MTSRRSGVPKSFILAALLAASAFTACSGDTSADKNPPVTSAPVTPERHLTPPNRQDDLLFVARADTGSLAAADGTTMRLVLTETDTITWFSDRPAHDAGVSAVADALEAFGWEANGDNLGVPPNAVLTANEFGDDSPVVEILDASIADGDLMFDIMFEDSSVVPFTGPITHVEMFIDSVDPMLRTFPHPLDYTTMRDATGTIVHSISPTRAGGMIIPDDTTLKPAWFTSEDLVSGPLVAGTHVMFLYVADDWEEAYAFYISPT